MRQKQKRNPRPHWNTLYLIMLVEVAGIAVGLRLQLKSTDYELFLFLMVIASYGLIALWLTVNALALENMPAEKCEEQSRDPVLYGTQKFPTRTQARFREVVSSYHHESLNKNK